MVYFDDDETSKGYRNILFCSILSEKVKNVGGFIQNEGKWIYSMHHLRLCIR